MKATEPCPICQITKCDCKTAVLSFFGVLSKVEQRVLSTKPSSIFRQPEVIGGGIDKLNGYFRSPVPKQTIFSNAKAIDASVRRVFLKDRKPYLEVSLNKGALHLKLGMGETDVTCYITNPNKFNGWSDYATFLSAIVPQDSLNSAVITRVDLNLDFACDFPELLKSIDIKNKHCALTYEEASGKRTGMIIGKGDETIAVYDKSGKEKLNKPVSRLELRMSGEKLHTRSITDFQTKLLRREFFSQLIGMHIKEANTLKQSQAKVIEFNTLIRRDGFFATKRALSSNRNFDRDYGKLFTFETWQKQPTELFKNEIHKFFNNKVNPA